MIDWCEVIDEAYAKWMAGACHDPGCGCVTQYIKASLAPWLVQHDAETLKAHVIFTPAPPTAVYRRYIDTAPPIPIGPVFGELARPEND